MLEKCTVNEIAISQKPNQIKTKTRARVGNF